MAETKSVKAPEKFIRLLKNAMDDHPEKPSLREVARRADLSPAYLSLLLNGERSAPSNSAIAQIEQVLNLPKNALSEAAGKPTDAALDFFRKDEAGSIMRTLAKVPNSQLAEVRQMIEGFVSKRRPHNK